MLTLMALSYSPAGLAYEDTKEDIGQPLDIRAPGPDLANFPNSAFTLPKGGFYLETSPATFTSKSRISAPQYNWEYLLRYGLFDWAELRLYSPGFSVQGDPRTAVGFSPLTFDTKLHLWDEMAEHYLPAAGLELVLQTNLLGSPAFNGGTEPSFSLNFDQGLPWDLQIEYNLGAARFQNPQDLDNRQWDVTFSWAIQREIIEDVAIFLNGYYNASNLPRVGRTSDRWVNTCPVTQSICDKTRVIRQTVTLGGKDTEQAIGIGSIWTLNDHAAVYTNLAAGFTSTTPGFNGYMGFAWTP